MSESKTSVGGRRVSLRIGILIVLVCFGLGVVLRTLFPSPEAWLLQWRETTPVADRPTSASVVPPTALITHLPVQPVPQSELPSTQITYKAAAVEKPAEPTTEVKVKARDEKEDSRSALSNKTWPQHARRARSPARAKQERRGAPKTDIAGSQAGPLTQLPIVGPVVGLILPGN